jgi:hypothetical protein
MEDPFEDMDLMDHLMLLREEQEFIYSKFTLMRRNINALVKSNVIICILKRKVNMPIELINYLFEFVISKVDYKIFLKKIRVRVRSLLRHEL